MKKASQALKQSRPAYHQLIEFYEQVFMLQEDVKSRIFIAPIVIPLEILSIKQQENLPLLAVSEFRVDIEAANHVLNKLCQIAQNANPAMALSAKMLIENGKPDAETLFTASLDEYADRFGELENESGIDRNMLEFFSYHSIRPSLLKCAEQVSAYLKKDRSWEKGYCPICGNEPVLSLLKGHGERFMVCGFCWHEWQSKRIFCPFCENSDSKTLSYFSVSGEEEYRVSMCDRCKRHIKTSDMRTLSRPVYPPLEHIATIHLDMIAKKEEL